MGVSGLGLEGLTSDSAGGGGVPDSPLILQGLGVVGAPELTFIGDLDTGIYSPAADQMGLVAGGIEVARASEGVEGQFIVSPGQFLGSAALPALAIGDGDTGFYETFDDVLFLAIGGVNRFIWADAANSLQGAVTGAGSLRNEVASAINPTLGPRNDDADTGIGSSGADSVSIIGGGVELLRASETGDTATDQIFLPREGDAATPALALGAVDRGWYSAGVAQLNASIGGVRRLFFNSSAFTTEGLSIGVDLSAGPRMLRETASATNPTMIPRQNDLDSGIGSFAADNISIVAGGLEAVRAEDPADLAATETSLWIFDDDNAAMNQVTVGAADSGGAGFKLLRIIN